MERGAVNELLHTMERAVLGTRAPLVVSNKPQQTLKPKE